MLSDDQALELLRRCLGIGVACDEYSTPKHQIKTRDLLAKFADHLFQDRDLSKLFNQQSLKLCTAQPGKGRWRQHIVQRIHATESAQGKIAALPTLLPPLLP